MNLTKNDILQMGCITGFIATIGYAIAVTRRLHEVSNKLDRAVDNLVDTKEIDIPKDMINRSIERAVDREVRMQVGDSCKAATKAVENDIYKEIKSSVEDEFKRQKGDVAKELKRQINDLDISEIKKEVIREAKDTAANKFKHDLDDILEKHNDELESVTRIYSSIADKISSIGD